MGKIGYGYGSEWHLLRYLGYHREELNRRVAGVLRADSIEWLDVRCDKTKKFLYAEWKGLDFLGSKDKLRKQWQQAWPQSGNVPNWDAVGRARIGKQSRWVLVEAKAHLGEVKSSCGAKQRGGRGKIEQFLNQAKRDLGVPASADWLSLYYQYANRLAILNYLNMNCRPASLLMLYFYGHGNHKSEKCPENMAAWGDTLRAMDKHLGLRKMPDFAHNAFLPLVYP